MATRTKYGVRVVGENPHDLRYITLKAVEELFDGLPDGTRPDPLTLRLQVSPIADWGYAVQAVVEADV